MISSVRLYATTQFPAKAACFAASSVDAHRAYQACVKPAMSDLRFLDMIVVRLQSKASGSKRSASDDQDSLAEEAQGLFGDARSHSVKSARKNSCMPYPER